MMPMFRIVIALLFLPPFLCGGIANAQKETDNWFFGYQRGLNFGAGYPVALVDTTFRRSEGGSTLSNPEGVLMLSCDGEVIWDRSRLRMPNGQDLLGGRSASNAALCIPLPGSEHLVYVITSDSQFSTDGLRYSVVDMRLRNGLGDVIRKNELILAESTEHIGAVHHANGRDIWLVAPRFGTDQMLAWLITDEGISREPVVSRIGRWFRDRNDKYGTLRFSNCGGRIAMALKHYDMVDVYGFNVISGSLVYELTVKPEDVNLLKFDPYGLCFSSDSDLLYISTHATDTIRLFQLSFLRSGNLNSIVRVVVLDSLDTKVPSFNRRLYGNLQMASDGKIYHAISWGSALGVIHHPDSLGSAAGYRREMMTYADGRIDTSWSAYGLNAFVQSYLNPLRFSQQYSCFNSEAVFRISTMRSNDSVRWYFDDALSGEDNTARGDVVTHRFSAPGDYWVTALLHQEETIDTVRQLVRIYPLPSVLASGDTAVCGGESVRLHAAAVGGRPPYLYRWEPADALDDPGSPSPVARPSRSTTYRVTIHDDNDCIAEDSVRVLVRDHPVPAFPRSVAVCRGDSVTIGGAVEGGTPPYRYDWSVSPDIAETDVASQRVAPSASTVYRVRITDAAGCRTDDSVRVDVLDAPVLSATREHAVCRGESVTLEVRISSQAPVASIAWSPVEGLSDAATAAPVASPSVSTLYTCTVVTTEGCVAVIDVVVDVLEAVTPAIRGDTVVCEGSAALLEVRGEYVEHLWSTGERGRSIIVHEAGEYGVRVRDANGCTAQTSVTVRMLPLPEVAITGPATMYEGDTIRLDAGDGHAEYVWSTGATGRYLVVTSGGMYGVTVTDGHGCRASASHTLLLKGRPFAMLSLPDIEAAPGDTVCIGLELDGYGNAEDFDNVAFEAVLRFDRSLLHPLGVDFTDEGGDRLVSVRATRRLAEEEAVWRMCGVVTLGGAEETALTLERLEIDPSVFSRTLRNGILRVKVCREGGARLFTGDLPLRLHQNHPNPFNASTLIRFDIIERGQTRLVVHDLYGRRVATLVDAELQPGSYIEVFDASRLASGQYLCILSTPTAVVSRLMTVVK